MCVVRKPQPFGNERHAITCVLSKIMWFVEKLEGRYCPRERGRPEFDDIGNTVGTMLRCTLPLWNCTKVITMDTGFCFTNGLVEL